MQKVTHRARSFTPYCLYTDPSGCLIKRRCSRRNMQHVTMLQKHTRRNKVNFEVLTAVLMKIHVFRHMTTSIGTQSSSFQRSVLPLSPRSMQAINMEAESSSETSVTLTPHMAWYPRRRRSRIRNIFEYVGVDTKLTLKDTISALIELTS